MMRAGGGNADDKMMRRAWSLYGLLVLASVVYCAWLFGGLDQWGRGDWDQFSFRYETPRRALLDDGQLPLWNPYVNGGTVLLAHPHCPAFSPWYLPTLVLGAPLGLRVSVVLFMALGATGMAALLRRWDVSLGGAFVGGVLLMMSTHFALHVTEGHLEWCVLGLMPWVMLCLVRAEDDWRFAILGGLLFASGLLYGSIYIVAVFVPVFALWAVLEAVRTCSWRTAVSCAAVIGLTFLLCAVVLFPRIEFLRANPRRTRQDEQVSPAALGRMLLDPRQADLFRQTRDVRNPPDAELDRLLPARSSSSAKMSETLRWHRLEVVLKTTSDWADVRFQGFPYRLFPGGLGDEEKTPAQLNALPQTTEWLAIQNPDLEKSKQTVRATLYVRLPDRGDLEFLLTQGNTGATALRATRGDATLLDVRHSPVAGDLKNERTFSIPRYKILGRQSPDQQRPAGPWYQVDATLRTTAAWCDVQVVNSPYVFQVRGWKNRRQTEIRPSMSGLATGSFSSVGHENVPPNGRPGKAEALLEATLYFQRPEEESLRMAILQSAQGTSTLTLKTPQGDPIASQRSETTAESGEKTVEYVLPREILAEQLQPVPTPLRWRLNRLGMWRDWHEYGCYPTWLGLAMALLGIIVAFRRQWPLLAAGLLAGLVMLGGALPLNFWALWKQLPMYGSLQVPSRFLVAVVFVIAVCGGYGVDRMGRWAEKIGGRRLGRLLVGGIGLAVYVELAALGWNLFSDIFVYTPKKVTAHEQFAQRYADDDQIRYPGMYSAHYPYLMANSGVLREYENIAVKRGEVRVTTDPDYRGEAYLENSRGTAEIVDWSMSRVKVRLEVKAADRLVLNQNYFQGWRAIRRDAAGRAEKLRIQESSDGLVSIGVGPGRWEIEFYYLPDGLAQGAIVSGLTLLGCLALLLAGSRKSWKSERLKQLATTVSRRCGPVLRSPAAVYLTGAVALNVPFLVCHPGWTWIDVPLVRSLAINVVLFLAPGLPLVGLMVGRGWALRLHLLWVIVVSFVVFVALLTVAYLAGLSTQGGTIWNGAWAFTNLAILLNVALRKPPADSAGPGRGLPLGWRIRPHGKAAWIGLLTFAVAYLGYFYGATDVVPLLDDHDYETQGTAHSLAATLQMRLLTDRKTDFCYAHPPLLHVYVVGSFLYYGQMDDLAFYDAAWNRVRLAEQGKSFPPVVDEFFRVPDKKRLTRSPGAVDERSTRHRIVGLDGEDYLVSPPLPKENDWISGDRVSVREMEVQMLYDRFRRNADHRLATRTPNVFLAALTVGLLAWWIVRRTGRGWLGLLVPLTYATNPEVFVRSSYGGYFAISNFALLQVLLAVEYWRADRSPAASMGIRQGTAFGIQRGTVPFSPSENRDSPRVISRIVSFRVLGCLMAGAFAGLANHKLVLLPIAIVAWNMLPAARERSFRKMAKALLHPVMIGFAAGTLIFWSYGLAVSPSVFLLEHLRYHLVDRLVGHNPLGYGGYPSPSALWIEFWHHTGYVLLPLGVLTLVFLCWARDAGEGGSGAGRGCRGWGDMPGLWAVWGVLTAAAFSLIDWRQTKHLMPLLLPLHLAPACWAARTRTALVVVSVLFAGLLVWNLNMLGVLAADFPTTPYHARFPITPAW